MAGCGNEAPNCTDPETKKLVIEIANSELKKEISADIVDSVKLSVKNVRTTDVNEKVGSFECAADLIFTGPGGVETLPITYTSELVDGGDNFYVNVYGL